MTWDTARVLRPVLAAAAVLLFASACSPRIEVATPILAADPTLGPCAGIAVVVDERAMSRTADGGYASPSATCVETDDTMTAQAALNASNDASVNGTTEAGPAVVCRVNGTPNSTVAIAKPGGGIYFETCESTPPDYARWVVWHKPAGGDWESASQDITVLEVAPGETVALVFAYLGEPSTPSF